MVSVMGLLLLSMGCAERPALRVGDVTFEETELRGLSDDQVHRLALITAVGIGTARRESDVLGGAALDHELYEIRIRRLRDAVILEEAGIDEDSLHAIYLNDPEPELVVRHLVILSERWESDSIRSEARGRAAVALDRARAGASFPELAAEYSEEPGAAARGGRLEPGREGSWVREFWDAAIALEEGEVSEVVESPFGFHLIMLEERRAIPFEDARPTLVSTVAEEQGDPATWEARVSEWMAQIDSAQDANEPSPTNQRRRTLLAQAEARGITLSEADTARIRGVWEGRVTRWADAFGFEEGVSPGEISEVAMRALGRTEQSARIAREEILDWSSTLEAAYPVERSAP